MQPLGYFGQAANYNCTDANDSSYGAGAFGTCATPVASGSNNEGSTGTVQPGAPNTGEFFGFVTTGAFSIILPLVVAIAVVSAASLAIIRKKRSTQR